VKKGLIVFWMTIKIVCIEDCELNWIRFEKGEIYLYGNEGSGCDNIHIDYFYQLNGTYIGYVSTTIMNNFIELAEFREKRINSILDEF
jgi:hypothetical protein